MKEFLLDTTCFYRFSRNSHFQSLVEKLPIIISTSQIAICEIEHLYEKDDHNKLLKKQHAMQSLLQVTNRYYVTPDLHEIPKAYNRRFIEDSEGKSLIPSIKHFISAQNKDELNQSISSNLKNWKISWQTNFPNLFTGDVKYRTYSDKEFKLHLIWAFAVHAGLYSKKEFLASKNNKKLFNRLHNTAISNYNGGLDFYFDIFENMIVNLKPKNKVEKNRGFDLEFLFHMRPFDQNQIFVTTENELIQLINGVCPHRVIHLDDILKLNF